MATTKATVKSKVSESSVSTPAKPKRTTRKRTTRKRAKPSIAKKSKTTPAKKPSDAKAKEGIKKVAAKLPDTLIKEKPPVASAHPANIISPEKIAPASVEDITPNPPKKKPAPPLHPDMIQLNKILNRYTQLFENMVPNRPYTIPEASDRIRAFDSLCTLLMTTDKSSVYSKTIKYIKEHRTIFMNPTLVLGIIPTISNSRIRVLAIMHTALLKCAGLYPTLRMTVESLENGGIHNRSFLNYISTKLK